MGDRTEPSGIASGRAAWLTASAILAVGVLYALKITWLRWGDPILDTGREVGIAERLAGGAVLYRDVAFNYGPFTPYWNAAFFRILGPSISTLLVINFLNLSLAVVALVFVLRRLLEPFLVVILLGVFFLESVFQHYYINGTFSFLMPYSFSAVQACIASLFTLGFLLRFVDDRRRVDLWLASFGVGLIALCKIEVALAAGLALVATAVISMAAPGVPAPRVATPDVPVPDAAARDAAAPVRGLRRKTLVDALAPCALVVFGGFSPFLISAGADVVLRDNLFRLIVDRPSGFFDRVLGITDPAASLKAVFSSAAYWAAFLAGAAASAAWVIRTGDGQHVRVDPRWAPVWGLCMGAIGGIMAVQLFDPFTVFRGLPVLYAGFAMYTTFRLYRAFGIRAARDLVLSVFVLGSLLRIAFNTGTFHYGFFLALPAVVLLSVLARALLASVRRDDRVGRFGSWAVAFCLLTISLTHFITVSLPAWRLVTAEMAGPRGTIRVLPTPVNYYVAASMPQFATTIPERSTLTVFPEGALIGFLLGCSFPGRYLLMTPPEVVGREAEILGDLQAHPAEFVLLVDRDVSDFGSAGPGIDYGHEIMRYFAATYDTLFGAGPLPYGSEPGGWLLFRRKANR